MLGRLISALFSTLIPPKDRSILFVAATRLGEPDFYTQTHTGRWLKKRPHLARRIYFNNSKGLSSVYNDALRNAKASDILVFVHDDVWIEEPRFPEAIFNGLRRFDVLGIAGNKRRQANQYIWFLKPEEDGLLVWDSEHLSGSVMSGDLRQPAKSVYGNSPAPCELMDGVIFIARAGTLKKKGVMFDEAFDFHFYDLDFCRTSRAKGLKLGTWPLEIFHASPGAYNSDGWRRNRDIYQRKWGS
ncbi:MAG: glycosyltransferase [Acidovorax sp.]